VSGKSSKVGGFHQGPIRIKQDGKVLNLHVAALEAGLVKSNGDGSAITMKWGGETRAFVVKQAMDDMPLENYHDFVLLNRELSYDVDLGTVGCSCNAALFFSSMPGYGMNGEVAMGDNAPFYCDANKIGGVWCWEHDVIESNMWAIHSTPHTCNAPAEEYISSCDRGGCSANPPHDSFCPAAHCTIDTRRPFRHHQRFVTDPTKKVLSAITNKLVQGNRSVEWSACPDAKYLAQMTPVMAGKMKMVFQLWGDTYKGMDWLDASTGCSGACDSHSASMTISNIEITPLQSAEITQLSTVGAPMVDLRPIQIARLVACVYSVLVFLAERQRKGSFIASSVIAMLVCVDVFSLAVYNETLAYIVLLILGLISTKVFKDEWDKSLASRNAESYIALHDSLLDGAKDNSMPFRLLTIASAIMALSALALTAVVLIDV
jgi:hypothetical protein